MNKVFKHTLIAGGLICAAGLVLSIAGYLLGGNEYAAKADLNKMDGSAMREDGISIQEKMKIEGIKGINIDFEYADLNIKPSGDESCYLEYVWDKSGIADEDAEPVIWDVTDGVLSMKEAPAKKMLVMLPDIGSLLNGTAFEERKSEVTVYVPEGTTISDGRIRLDYGDVSVSGACWDSAEISMEYGDLTMKDATVNEGEISLADGNFGLKDSNLHAVQIDMEYGDFSFQRGSMTDVSAGLSDGDASLRDVVIAGNCGIEGQYGDVTVMLDPACLQTLAMQLETSYGDVEVDGAITGAKSTKDDNASFMRSLPDAAASLTIDLDDGNITIK